jgi:hypothetical protein
MHRIINVTSIAKYTSTTILFVVARRATIQLETRGMTTSNGGAHHLGTEVGRKRTLAQRKFISGQ